MKIITSLALFSLLIITSACTGDGPANNSAKPAGSPEISRGIGPIPDDEIAIIEMENAAAFGTIKLELFSNIAPKMVARFKELAREGVYSGTTFHRINQSVIQGGDPLSKDDDPNNDGQGKSDKPNVEAEFSDLAYEAGILGAARGHDNHSANSQFFITLKRESGFDNRYTIFGRVIDGMNHVRTIAGVQPKVGERPAEPVRIKQITIVPRGEAK